MKKTVLAFAVAAAMGVPAVAAADTTLYGRFNVSLDRMDNGAHTGTQLASNSSRIGVRGSEDLGGGLSGVFQMEAGFDAASGGGNLATRNTFVGLGGDFGEVRLGRHDTPYKIATLRLNFFADTIGDMHNIMGTVGAFEATATSSNQYVEDDDGNEFPLKTDSVIGASGQFYQRPNNTIVYMTPSFEGFQAMASYTTDARATGDRPSGTAGDRDGYSLAATYSNGPIFVAAAYERWNEWGGAGVGDPNAWKVGGTYQIDDLTLAAAYERIDTKDFDGSRNSYHLGARYNLGQTYLMASYTVAGDLDTDETGAKMWALGAGYNLSRRTGLYAVYADVNNDDDGTYSTNGTGKGKGTLASDAGDKVKGFSVGVWHNF